MATGRDDVLQQALALPPQDRAYVVAAIEQSMGAAAWPPNEVTADSTDALQGSEFLRELERRSAAFRAGTSPAYPATEVIAELLQRQDAEEAK